MEKYKLLIQYDGTSFSGWQRQGNTKNTIQGKIEDVLSRMINADIQIEGASRTDQGVHARGQVASFTLKASLNPFDIRDYLNNYLPKSIAVTEVEKVNIDFHPRHDAKKKEYIYRIWNSPIRNVFENPFLYTYHNELDINLMQEAASVFIGEKDFRAYATKVPKKRRSIRTIYSIIIEKKASEISLSFLGDGFLYNMIRIISGSLLEVGRGRLTKEDLERGLVGPTLPGQGLTLNKIYY